MLSFCLCDKIKLTDALLFLTGFVDGRRRQEEEATASEEAQGPERPQRRRQGAQGEEAASAEAEEGTEGAQGPEGAETAEDSEGTESQVTEKAQVRLPMDYRHDFKIILS